MADVDIKIRIEAAKAQAQLSKLNSQIERNAASVKKARLQNELIQKRIDNVGKSVQRTSRAFDVFKGVLGANFVSGAVNQLGRLVSAFGGFIIDSGKAAAEIETIKTQFEVLTGSATTAEQALQDLSDFAANTPFQLIDLAKSQQRLLAFGLTVEESKDVLVDLGDVAAASGANIGELSTIFGQVAAAGKLTGERLLQLEERAVPIGPAIAQTLGVAEGAVRDLVKNGKVDFETFQRAFETLNEEGQFAFNGLQKASQTLEGRISTLKDNFALLQADIGRGLSPAFKAITTAFTGLIQSLRQSGAIDRLVETFANFLPRAIQFAFNSLRFFIDLFFNARQAFNTFNVAIDSVLAGFVNVGVGALNAARAVQTFFGRDTSGIDAQINALKLLREGFEEQAIETLQENEELEKSQQELAQVVANSKQFIINEYNKEREAISQTAEEDTMQTQKRIENVKALTLEQVKANEERLKQEKQLQEQLRALREENKILEEAERITQDEVDVAFFQANIEELQAFLSEQEAAEVAARLRSTEGELERQVSIEKIRQDGYNKRLRQQEQAERQEIQLEQRTARAKAQVLSSFFNLAGAIAKDGSKQQFLIQQAGALASAIVSTQQAAAQALAVPPAPNFGLAGLAKAAGALNIAAIGAQTIKGFEQGGIVAGSSFTGDNVAARVNSGEMILNREQQTQLFNLANGNAQNSQAQQEIVVQSTIMLNEEVVGEAVSRQVANGLVLGEVQ